MNNKRISSVALVVNGYVDPEILTNEGKVQFPWNSSERMQLSWKFTLEMKA
jgi:hypothetical protein